MPELIVKLGDKLVQRYVFDKDVISIGRARDNDIVIENLSVSRNHARIRRADGKFILTDLNSANGTMVNMVRVTKHEIVDGDLVQIGKHTLAFSTKESSQVAEPPPPAAKPGGMQTVPQQAGMASVGMASVGAGGAGDADLPNPGMVCVVKGKQVDQKFRVGKRETTIGRANDNDVRLFDWFVSKKHAQIVRRDNGFYLKDLQSWRGTTVNGQNVRSEVQLKEGDEITLGTTVLRFSDRIPPELEAELAAQAAVAAKARVLSDDDAIAGDDMPPPDYATKNVDPASREDLVAGVAGYRQPKSGDTVPVKAAGENPFAQAPAAPPAQPAEDRPPPPPQGTAPLDEFAPISEQELEALEAEADAVIPADQMEQLVRQEWENFELENMASMGERIEDSRRASEEKRQQAEEEKGFRPPTESLFDQTGQGFTSQELEIEEKALFGEAPEPEKAKGPAAKAPAKPTAPAPEPSAPAVAVAAPPHFTASDTPLPISQMDAGEREAQIRLWTRALKNPSEMIRAYAEKELRKLTGQHHDQQ